MSGGTSGRTRSCVAGGGCAARGWCVAVAIAIAALPLAVALAGETTPAAGDPGREARDAVAALAAEGDGFELDARLAAPNPELPLGAPVAWRVATERPASLLLLHVDAQGVGTLLAPNGLAELAGDRPAVPPAVEPGAPLVWPTEEAGFSLAAEPPIGREMLLVVATAEPVTGESLGLAFDQGPFAIVEASDVAVLVGRIREVLVERDAGSWSTTLVEQRVLARDEGPEVLAEEMVAYFVTRSRAIKRPRLDLHVHFATGSAELDPQARRNLDQVAQALADRRLAGARFRVAGHTDSVGELAFNDSLSEARARAVAEYLIEVGGIAPERIELAYYGERRPVEPNDTAEGRSMNRRVEFELIRGS